jgi:hypothetical protein
MAISYTERWEKARVIFPDIRVALEDGVLVSMTHLGKKITNFYGLP